MDVDQLAGAKGLNAKFRYRCSIIINIIVNSSPEHSVPTTVLQSEIKGP